MQGYDAILKGKWVIWSVGDRYKLGQIREMLGGIALVQFESSNTDDEPPTPPMELVSVEEMVSLLDDGLRVWGFFDKPADMYAFAAWVNNPEKPKIVSLVPRKP